MEMLVVLVISGIIITAALMFYLNYENLVRNKNKQMDCGKATLQFYQIFKHEFDNASMVSSQRNEVSFQFPAKTPVQYDIEQDFIVRLQDNRADTFFMQVNDLNILKDQVTGLDKTISMELQNCGEVFPIILVKEYSNDIMMNRNQ
jgi:hypothetical protein